MLSKRQKIVKQSRTPLNKLARDMVANMMNEELEMILRDGLELTKDRLEWLRDYTVTKVLHAYFSDKGRVISKEYFKNKVKNHANTYMHIIKMQYNKEV